jgi:hypothetical protein
MEVLKASTEMNERVQNIMKKETRKQDIAVMKRELVQRRKSSVVIQAAARVRLHRGTLRKKREERRASVEKEVMREMRQEAREAAREAKKTKRAQQAMEARMEEGAAREARGASVVAGVVGVAGVAEGKGGKGGSEEKRERRKTPHFVRDAIMESLS